MVKGGGVGWDRGGEWYFGALELERWRDGKAPEVRTLFKG